ncbi:hypothetical protein E0E62_29475 [Streptomyces sp. 16-176A]|nr:conserved hypothetical protein [Streptomyces sp. e14]MBY8865048.1 hypothetical protein [Streptomyces sennicomposti]MYS42384.1 hypothetical protein [Streptomyces sp. SID5998]MYX29107.1 hypothetical protein [Streptomyces sp. SID8381]MYX47418.1 hypothetical protein [Streptomyces sp. SID89]NED31387.1 hypothetical protein [Streptomyces sp. SID8499]NMO35570.1 hypothetical protein [Streptomyces sp. GMY02]
MRTGRVRPKGGGPPRSDESEEASGQMETTSRAVAQAPAGEGGLAAPAARRAVDGYLLAPFPWYGLDEAFTGPRWLMQVGASADGSVEHGSIGHGDEPSVRNEFVSGSPDEPKEKFAVVVTVAANPVRQLADGTGRLEATTVSSAAWLAGVGLLSFTWPMQMDHALRDDWLEQQTETAWVLADDLSGPDWSTLSLPVDGVPASFHYRESEYGWVLAGTTEQGVHLGAYGRGMSAYGLGFAVVKDITAYA